MAARRISKQFADTGLAYDDQGPSTSKPPTPQVTSAKPQWLEPAGEPAYLPAFPEAGLEPSQSLSASSVHALDDSYQENSLQWAAQSFEQSFDQYSSYSQDDHGAAGEQSWQEANGALLVETFESHETQLGLELDWSEPLPVVTGVHPGSSAEVHSEIMPGLVVVAVNDTQLLPGADPQQTQELFTQRPLSIVFDCRRLQGRRQMIDPTDAPNQIYQVGECYRAITQVLMRSSEALDSEIVAECLEGAILQIVEKGVGFAGQRLKVAAGNRIGWVSCMTAAGTVLLATKPALLIPPRSPARLTPQFVDDSREELTLKETVSLASLEDETKEQRRRRHELILQETAKVRHRGSAADEDDQEQERLSKKSSSMRMIQKQFGKIRAFGRKTKRHKGTKASQSLTDSSSSDEDLTEEELQAAMGKTDTVAQREAQRKNEEIKEMVKSHTVLFQEEMADHTGGSRIGRRVKRLCCIDKLQVKIKVMRLRKEIEEPGFAASIVEDKRFEVFIGLAIVLNAVCIALETFHDADRVPPLLGVAEHVFTVIFLCEWVVRVMEAMGLYFLSWANLIDTFLVWIAGVMVVWILAPAGVDVSSLRRFGCLRLLRLCRLCRAVRLMPIFKDLWMLVQGIVECGRLLIWSLLLGGVIHYTFAVACIELITKNSKFATDSTVQSEFGSLPQTMFTLFQIMTFDSCATRIRPIINEDPKTALLFFLFIGLAGIVLFNLMTAIVVRNAFDASKADTEAAASIENKRLMKVRSELTDIFRDLDEDQSGWLSKEEFLDCLDDFSFVRKMKMLDIDIEELPDIFEILDDGDGQVDQSEFITGMLTLQGTAKAPDMIKATALMEHQNVHFTALEDSFVENALETFRTVDRQVDDFHERMNEIILISSMIVEKLDIVGIRKVHRGTVNALKELPFLEDPTLEELARADKQRRKDGRRKVKSRRGSGASATDENGESFARTIIPPSWIVREGRSPAVKNPGKTKLARNPALKDKLIKGQKQFIKGKTVVAGICKEFGVAWEDLQIPLNVNGALYSDDDASNDLPPCPNHFNFMPATMSGGLRPPPPPAKKTITTANHPTSNVGLDGTSAGQSKPADVPLHPHAVPQGEATTASETVHVRNADSPST